MIMEYFYHFVKNLGTFVPFCQQVLKVQQHACFIFHYLRIIFYSLGLPLLQQHCCALQQFETVYVNTLCIYKNDQYHFVLFQYTEDLVEIVEPFWDITRTFCSRIFTIIWKKTIESSQRSIALTQLKSDVWTPTYNACRILLQKFSTMLITIGELSDYFGSNDEFNTIAKELHNFSQGMKSSITLDTACITSICSCLEIYRHLERSHEAADLVLRIRTLLSLEGNFDHLEHIAMVSDYYNSIIIMSFNSSKLHMHNNGHWNLF